MPGLSSIGAGLWNLGAPIEVVLLNNQEQSTTYSDTGDTGLLLDEVSLPAPKNHQYPAINYAISVETKQGPLTGSNVSVSIRASDGSIEQEFDRKFVIDNVADRYRFYPFDYLVAYIFPPFTSISRKGNQSLKIRVYIVGDSGKVNNTITCRNCVLTIIPLYKS